MRAADCEPKVVLYVRSQADYAESLYAQLVKYHGLARSFEAFLAEIASRGAARLGDWTFCFDYARLANAFAGAFGRESIILRAYNAGSSADTLFADFTALVAGGLDARMLEKPGRLHRAPAFADVLEALHANVSSQFPDAPTVQTLANELFPNDRKHAYLRGRFDILGYRDAQQFQQSFAQSNLALQTAYGVRVPDPVKRAHFFGRRDAEKRKQLFAAATKRWLLSASP